MADTNSPDISGGHGETLEQFEWLKESCANHKKILAFGIQLSIDYGYGGAIYLKAKTTQLREHYMKAYGAIPFSRFDPFLLLIDGEAARELFGQYLKED